MRAGTGRMEVHMEDFKRGDTASWDARQVRHSREVALRLPQRPAGAAASIRCCIFCSC